MRHSKTIGSLLLAALLVVGTVAPAAAAATSATPADRAGVSQVDQSIRSTASPANNTTNETGSNVTVGQQLSTVISVTGDEVQTDFENSAFEAEFEGANETKQAEAIAERAEELREKAESIREDYREATEAYRAGELTKSQYAQRLAVLNSRAENLLSSYRTLRERAANVSALELRAAGFNRTALERSTRTLDNVTGAGPAALLKRYTGQTTGEFEIETKNGLTVAVESEDGERSLEIERPRDDDNSVTVDQSAALQTARSALGPAPDNGTWALTESSIHADSGYYKFEFNLKNANATGEAEVRVDGSTGEVFRLEQEVEPASEREEEEREPGERGEGEDEAEDRELALLVASGTPAPGETITVQTLSAGEPAGNVTVYVDDRAVGTTDADGTISVTLPNESATVKAVSGEQEAELEFEFEREEEDVYRNLNVTGSADNETVTISATYNGTPVQNAAVYANGEQVGTTGADGTVTFTTNATDELEVEVVKGEFEAELVFTMTDGSLTLTTEPHEGDGDKDSDEREEETDETESDEDAEETTTTDSDEETDEETTTTTEDEEGETEDEEETTTTTAEDEDEEEDDETTATTEA